jgi:hypothetical protein
VYRQHRGQAYAREMCSAGSSWLRTMGSATLPIARPPSYQFTHDRFGRRKVLVERSARHLRRADDVVDRRRRVRFSTSNRNALLSNSERMRWRRLAATR